MKSPERRSLSVNKQSFSASARMVEKPASKLPLPRGYFYSVKMDSAVPYQRLAERDLMYLLELDPAVRRYIPKPATVYLRTSKGRKKHLFAFRVESATTGITMVDLIFGTPNTEVLNTARAVCHKRGYRYAAIPVSVVASEPRLSNAKFIHHHHSVSLPEEALLVLSKAMGARMCRLGDLESSLGKLLPASKPRQFVLAAAAAGLVRLDIGENIGADTEVSLVPGVLA